MKRNGTQGRGRAQKEEEGHRRKIKGKSGRERGTTEAKGEEGRERANHADNCQIRKRKGKQWR